VADVFISYKREERPRVLQVAAALERLGLSVWFDARIPSGSSFDEVIVKELDRAQAVLACWSPRSIKSKYVKGEASYADTLKSRHNPDVSKLITCFIEPAKLPPPFNMMQTEDIRDWDGSFGHEGWRKIVRRLGVLCDRPGLYPLLKALHSTEPEKLGAWLRDFPGDPAAKSMRAEWLRRENACFGAEIDIARRNLTEIGANAQAQAELKRAEAEAAFERLRAQFDTWLSEEVRDEARRPDPNSVLLGAQTDGDGRRVAALERALMLAGNQLRDMEGERDAIRADRDTIAADKDRLAASLAAKSAPSAMVTGRRTLAGAALLAILSGGALGYAAAYWRPPVDHQAKIVRDLTDTHGQLAEAGVISASAAPPATILGLADAVRQSWSAADARAASLASELNAAKEQVKAEQEKVARIGRDANLAARTQIDRLNTDLAAAQGQVKASQTEVAALKHQVATAQGDADILKRLALAAGGAAQRAADLDRQLKEAAANLATEKEKSARLTVEFNAASRRITETEQQSAATAARLALAEKASGETRAGREAAERDLRAEKDASSRLRQDLEAAERRAREIAQDRDQSIAQWRGAERERDEARAEVRRLKDAPPQPAFQTSLPQPAAGASRPPVANAAELCSDIAGNRFDTDNRTGRGPQDMSTAGLSDERVAEGIRACDQAARAAVNQVDRRRMEAQRGRAQAELATRYASSNPAGARQLMDQALISWRSAAASGSGFAMNMLGTYYFGSFNRNMNFAVRDLDQAHYWWKQAADAGNSTGRVNYAALLLDKESPSFNNPAEAARQLSLADPHNPRAFIVWADGTLSGQFGTNLSLDQRRRRAAELAERARCNGDAQQTEVWFSRNSTLRSYRNTGVC
jgi:hypothetical protein